MPGPGASDENIVPVDLRVIGGAWQRTTQVINRSTAGKRTKRTKPHWFRRSRFIAMRRVPDFAAFAKSPAWPTNDSVIYERPLVENGGGYYCFHTPLLHRQTGFILEQWVRRANPAYFENTFQKRRSDLVDRWGPSLSCGR